MAVRYYDEAVKNKIQDWVMDTNMRILGPNETNRLFSVRADDTNDKPLKLPLIAISRDPTIQLLNTSKKAMTYDGMHIVNDENISVTINAIPIQMNYQIDIFCKYFEEADEYARNFAFNLINYPTMYINIPYNGANLKRIATIKLDPQVVDNSSIPERLVPGQFTRMTLRFTIDDAYYFSIPIMQNWKVIEEGVEVEEI